MREAVAIVMICDGEIFTVKRQNHLPSFPGYTSYPGGLVDLKDREHKSSPPVPFDQIESYLYFTARRELEEECGLNLKHSPPLLRVGLLGEATTPSFNPYRFKTWFIFLEFAHRPDFKLDVGEIESGKWSSPRALEEQFNRGDMLAVPPTVALFRELIKPRVWRNLPFLDLNLKFDPDKDIPVIEPLKDIYQYMPLSHTLPPATRTNCFIIGGVVIDPSPKDPLEYEKLLTGLQGLALTQVFLTHHHPDHHEQAPQLAREFNLPIGMSQDTHDRITRKWGSDYFKGLKVRIYQEGEVLTQWLEEDVLVYELPGHDEGQLGLAPRSLKWFLVGDLIQTQGTVVIGGDEGNMAKYMRSLEKVIGLNPECVFPSHGIGMGGVFKCKETLKHRHFRENQIIHLLKQGVSPGDMVSHIYPDLKKELLPLAELTIQAHVKKILEENKLASL